MANTLRFNQLTTRINIIENSYLPVVNPLGNYTSKQQDDLRAYLLLVHAEIEAYFEKISEDKVKAAFKAWELKRTKSNVLLALVSFCDEPLVDKELTLKVNQALTLYIKKLRNNHGIKEKNLLEILLPVGIEYNSIDTTWLHTMTSFGVNRGEVAHSTASVQQPLDPVILKNSVTLILTEIKNIDIKIKALR